MGIRLALERAYAKAHARWLASKLERMAWELGPVCFRTPEFLSAEMRLALALARLAAIEYEGGDTAAGERTFDRAEHIFMALRRCLPKAELDAEDRGVLERRMARLQMAVTRVSGMAMAA